MADDTRADVATRKSRQAVELAFKLADRLADEIGEPGTEEMSTREVNGLILDAAHGDSSAFVQVFQLAQKYPQILKQIPVVLDREGL